MYCLCTHKVYTTAAISPCAEPHLMYTSFTCAAKLHVLSLFHSVHVKYHPLVGCKEAEEGSGHYTLDHFT